MLRLFQEAAGLALAFFPLMLMPTTIGPLIWLFGDWVSGQNERPAWTLAGTIAGVTPLVVLALVHLPSKERARPDPISDLVWSFVWWTLISLTMATGALVGYYLGRKASPS
jgi:hypothetical protein